MYELQRIVYGTDSVMVQLDWPHLKPEENVQGQHFEAECTKCLLHDVTVQIFLSIIIHERTGKSMKIPENLCLLKVRSAVRA